MWVKICGWNDPRLLEASLARATPDAIGLNFFPPSVRSVLVETAIDMRGMLPSSMAAVGVFVNATRDEVLRTVDRVGLTHVQLHGDESPEFVQSLGMVPVIRVYRPRAADLGSIATDLSALEQLGVRPWACLVDAYHETTYGGTGMTAPWKVLAQWSADWPPLILAGGLTPDNVSLAIQVTHPFGVDTASGCEVIKGRKDAELVTAFIEAAQRR